MTRFFSTRGLLLVALVAALLGGVATYGVSALTSTGKTEVRIAAQRLDNGRVEFGLQERADDGGWGERILPQRRFLPAEGFVNRWAYSSPLEIDSGLPFYLNTTEPTRSVTVEEYIALCSDEAALFEAAGLSTQEILQQMSILSSIGQDGDEIVTWGDYLGAIDILVTATKSISPPEALAEYYESQLAVLNLIAGYVFAQPSGAEVNIWELFGIGFIAAGIAQTAEQNLDPELWQRLVDGGCIEAEPEPEPEPSGSAESG